VEQERLIVMLVIITKMNCVHVVTKTYTCGKCHWIGIKINNIIEVPLSVGTKLSQV
jgi:hypothetical protein